ncbi:type III-B CRISPR module RAMP protein Cmr1 [Caldanaerobius polysaccharolyticus]|uniref:type III-B CRISPR module RAMP protein Cmr1 n=1 Tax=Caldanaerobius polysaccharolyticus TaxID=44256 RepID=UPI00047C6C2D|nr:type III-B CRISPR module RAMP protein Cmr1 [Caldanaerobius polysaccharolyticus]
MELKLTTLTPLWTGGVHPGEMDHIQEAGIIGSMRWWFEVFVRGVGGKVCNLTERDKCSFSDKDYYDSTAVTLHQRLRDAGLCDVCQVFGATKWGRRFRLEIIEDDVISVDNNNLVRKIKLYERAYTSNNGKKKIPTWWLWSKSAVEDQKPRIGNFRIQIKSLYPDFDPYIITGLIRFMSEWTAIGARPQLGFGVVKIDDAYKIDTAPLYNWLRTVKGNCQYSGVPSLKNIFLARVRVPNATFKTPFLIKYDLRRLFANDEDVRHFIMGTVEGDRIGAKIKMSMPYNDGILRIWGWVPEEASVYNNEWDRNKVLDAIYNYLYKHYNLLEWREMNSSRDTLTPLNNDSLYFIRGLLGLGDDISEL